MNKRIFNHSIKPLTNAFSKIGKYFSLNNDKLSNEEIKLKIESRNVGDIKSKIESDMIITMDEDITLDIDDPEFTSKND